ncbi:MAG: peptide deformylase [Candidatus Omnitrophota bacterium]
MAVLTICKYPDPILRRKAAPLEEISDEDKLLIKGMIETMRSSGGVGLAANQVGVSKRIFVFNPFPQEEWKADALINPVIIKRDGAEKIEEGCLSLPGVAADVRRYNRVTAKGLDINGKPVRFEAKGLLARIIQHEIDHLDGKLFVDRLNAVRKAMILRKFRRLS